MQQVEALGGQIENAQKVIDAAAETTRRITSYTNPDMLAAYVNDFFGPEGPYPTETAEDRLRAEVEATDARYAQAQVPVPQPQAPAFKRPEIDMPQPVCRHPRVVTISGRCSPQ